MSFPYSLDLAFGSSNLNNNSEEDNQNNEQNNDSNVVTEPDPING